MTYYFSKVINNTFTDTIESITKELKKEGFGVITEIDVKDTFKENLDVDFRKYKILGACNPDFTYDAINIEDNLGVLFPCNIVIQEKDEKETHVSTINPIMAIKSINNRNLESFAVDVSEALLRVLNKVE